jgi:lipoprotein-anchoring transpeptidase ErfK/SrfK
MGRRSGLYAIGQRAVDRRSVSIRMLGIRPVGLAALIVLAFVVAGCAGDDSGRDAAEPADAEGRNRVESVSAGAAASGLPSWRSYVATGGDSLAAIDVFESPGGEPLAAIPNRPAEGLPAVFLVRQLDVPDTEDGGWYEVWLPVRPNGSHGFVRAGDVSLSYHDYQLRVQLSDHEVELYTAGVLTDTFPVGVGEDRTPTPGGTFYTKELLKPTNRGGPYGTYAYGLSGFSNTLTDFAEGDGVVGLHGTDQPDSVGRDVSAGCIRMRNDDIEQLVERLPLGVPVEIIA